MKTSVLCVVLLLVVAASCEEMKLDPSYSKIIYVSQYDPVVQHLYKYMGVNDLLLKSGVFYDVLAKALVAPITNPIFRFDPLTLGRLGYLSPHFTAGPYQPSFDTTVPQPLMRVPTPPTLPGLKPFW